MNRLGDTSAFVIQAIQLLLTRRGHGVLIYGREEGGARKGGR